MNVGTSSEKFKAKFVFQVYRDTESLLVHYCSKFRQSSIRVAFGTAATLKLDLWSLEINQAYTRNATSTRLVYVKPDLAFAISPDTSFQIMRPLYGLADAGDASWRTLKKNLTDELGLRKCDSDPWLLYTDQSQPPDFWGNTSMTCSSKLARR